MPYKDKKKRRTWMREYMRDYRKRERALIRLAKLQFGFETKKKKERKK